MTNKTITFGQISATFIKIFSFKSDERVISIALKQLQTALWIVDALFFLIDCKQTWYPFRIELSQAQMFMQNGEYTAF